MKRLLCLILCMTFITCNLVFADAGTETDGDSTYKTVLVNVAHGKNVYSAATTYGERLTNGVYKEYLIPDQCTYNGADVTLPGDVVVPGAKNNGQDWYIIDLGRKYGIEQIKLYSRSDGGWNNAWMSHFDILVSNSIDFNSKDTANLGGIGSDPSVFNVTSNATPFTLNLDGSKAYRYVKIKKTAVSYHGYGEIEVYAKQTVTQIPISGAEAFTNSGSSLEGSGAINGTNSNDADAWVHDGRTAYNYLSVDLKTPYHVGMIEMEGRNISSENSVTRENFNVYASSSIDNLAEFSSSSNLSASDGYKTLHTQSASNTYPDAIYPKYPGMLMRSVNDDEAYRYLTVRNTSLHASAIGEIRFYEVNPDILSVNWDSEKLYIHFSDEMTESCATDSYITMTLNENSTAVGAEISREDSYTYSVDISSLDISKSYTLTVDKGVTNKKGVSLAEEYVLKLDGLYPVYSREISIYGGLEAEGSVINSIFGQESVSIRAQVSNHLPRGTIVKAILALYDSTDDLIVTDYSEYELDSGETRDVTASLTFGDELTDGMYIKAFVWQTSNGSIRPLTKCKKVEYDIYNIYVSASAPSGGRGTVNSPFSTIAEAQEIVRERNEGMTKDITVHLMEGTYALDSTWELTEEDSGKNGFDVIYTAYNNADVLITGGRQIHEDSWEIYNEEENIYIATVEGIEEIRDLYVDGRRARSARSTGRIRPIAMYYDTDGTTPLGFYVSTEDLGEYENPSDMRLFTTQVWKYTMWNVDSIIPAETEGQSIVIMEPNSAFKRAVNNAGSLCLSENNAFYMENALELLDEEGEFYFTEGTLYYKPAEGESFSNVYVPVLDKLLTITGSDMANKVHNIEFSGITFAHASRNDLSKGYLGGQAQNVTPLVSSSSAYPLDFTTVGANIRVTRAEDISFVNNIFTGLSAVGVGIYEGSNDIVIRGNIFYETGDSAVTVGLPSDAYMDEAYYGEDGTYLGRNVALYKNTTSNKNAQPSYNGNDGNATTVWTADTTADYWQVDLGKEYNISQIRMKSRLNTGSNANAYEQYGNYRRNFKVMGSNYADFSDGGKIIASQGSTAFDFAKGFIVNVEAPAKYRYIRVQKTVNEHFPMADIEVISPDITAPIKEVSKRTVIDNNYITRVGEFNLGAPGIQLYYTEGAEVSNNYIKDVPYSGICAGWGWLNTLDSTTAKNNRFLNNRIENYTMRTYDAGGIYLLGTQKGNVADGNYFKNQPNAYYTFYLDSGADNATFTNNVAEHVAMVYGIGTINSTSGKKNLVIKNNYSTSVSYVNNPADGTNSVVENPIAYTTADVPKAVADIISASGLESKYAHLVSKVPEGRWTLTNEDIYGDIIDHQLSTEGGSVGESMPDTTLIYYYLGNLIKDANNLYNLGKSLASDEALSDFKSAYDTANKKHTEFSNRGYGYNNTEKGPIDREDLINTRINLIEAMKTFAESITE